MAAAHDEKRREMQQPHRADLAQAEAEKYPFVAEDEQAERHDCADQSPAEAGVSTDHAERKERPGQHTRGIPVAFPNAGVAKHDVQQPGDPAI